MKSALKVVLGVVLVLAGVYPFVSQELAAMVPQLEPFVCPLDGLVTMLSAGVVGIGVHLALSVTRAYRLLVQYLVGFFAFLTMSGALCLAGVSVLYGVRSAFGIEPTFENFAILSALFVLGVVLYREAGDQIRKESTPKEKVILNEG